MPSRPRLLFATASLALVVLTAGCGKDATIPDPPDGGDTPDGGGTTASVPVGACRFVLRSGDERVVFEGTARARMNGSGNLEAQCEADDGGPATLRLGFGNATFDGPRTYKGDDFTSDATVDYEPTTNILYSSQNEGAGCTLVLTEAGPLDARGDSVVKGGHIASTFSCVALVASSSRAEPPSFVLEDGALAAVVEE